MAATVLYENEAEMQKHLSAIHLLSKASGISEDYIRSLYERELALLKTNARIKDFLSVLVSRRIKEHITSS
jgi:hypothetical protein